MAKMDVQGGRHVPDFHVCIEGRATQLRASVPRLLAGQSTVSRAYRQVKASIIKYHPEDDMDAYYDIKDPVCDIIMGGAETWAAATAWALGESDC